MRSRVVNIIVLAAIVLIFILLMASCPSNYAISGTNSVASIDDSLSKKIELRVYIENSGSMDAYMCDGSQLKDAVYAFVSDLERVCASTQLYYINSDVIPSKYDLDSFILNLKPAQFAASGGGRSSSDIPSMLRDIIVGHGSNRAIVSLFVSDCVLDLPGGAVPAFLGNKQTATKNAFLKGIDSIPNLAVRIVKLKSEFSGNYYYWKGHKELSQRLINVERPYYMWLIGDCDVLAFLESKVPIEKIQHGIEDCFSIMKPSQVSYQYGNPSFKGNNLPKVGNEYKAALQIDLSNLMASDVSLSNFKVDNPNLHINSVKEIKNPNSSFTNLLDISIASQNISTMGNGSVYYCCEIPQWVDSTTTEENDSLNSDTELQTVGLKYLVQGAYDAFCPKSPAICEIKYNIKKTK